MMKKVAKPAGHRLTVRHVMLGTVSTLGVLAAAATTASAKTITVKQGDTVWQLAQQEGLSVHALEQANPAVTRLNNSVDLIYAGQSLQLPTNHDGYVVQTGDTLSKIAQRYHVTVAQLVAWNHLSNQDLIYVGQRLTIKGGSVSQQSASAASQDTGSQLKQGQSQSPAPAAGQSQLPAQPAPAAEQQSPSQAVPAAGQAQESGQNIASQPASSSTTGGAQQIHQPVQPANQPAGQDAASGQVNADQQQTVTTQPAATGDSVTTAQTMTTQQAAQTVATQLWTQPAAPTQSAPANQPANNQQSTPAVNQQTTPASQSQPAAPATNSQANAPQQNNNADLQTGSVVGLAVKLANSNIPYVYGGSSLSGMDCSGLVDYVYAHSTGKQLPHYTVSLESCVSQKAVSQAQPGDLLFWGNHGSTYHVAIYIGNNQYVAAPQPGQNVEVETISSYFKPSFAGTVN
nr:C40 family peptidase [uncultured Limosilactobacillus sp.]